MSSLPEILTYFARLPDALRENNRNSKDEVDHYEPDLPSRDM
jgi:hypothetical protein